MMVHKVPQHTKQYTYIHGHVVNIIRTNLVWNADSMIKLLKLHFEPIIS